MSIPQRMGQTEFIAFSAMMFATIAFSVDAMLPALPEIAAELSPLEPNSAQLILTSFVLGMGIGTFIAGPLSDSFGRKKIIAFGAALYCGAAFVAWWSTSLEVMLAARVIQGIGASGPRVVTMAIVRDLYSGREMAKIMSFSMMIFTLVPAIAPLMGAGIIALTGWRGIFVAFVLFSMLSILWMQTRLVESLAIEDRRPFRAAKLWEALKELMTYPEVRVSILAQSLAFGMLFTMLSLVQPVYDVTFGRADSFPFWFGIVALVSGSASFLNAKIVVIYGMRRVVTWIFAAQIGFASAMVVAIFMQPPDHVYFAIFVAWQVTVFFQAGLTVGNLNAMAMEPVGHIAGLAASTMGGVATILGVALAAPVGLLFAGSPMPLAVGVLCEAVLATLLMAYLARVEGRRVAA